MHGLKLTLNVQQYEKLPFSDQDSGIKASVYFLSCQPQERHLCVNYFVTLWKTLQDKRGILKNRSKT